MAFFTQIYWLKCPSSVWHVIFIEGGKKVKVSAIVSEILVKGEIDKHKIFCAD